MLGCVHLFSELAPEDTRALTEHSKIRTYPGNTILINEGDYSDSLFVILDGRVKAYASNENGKDVTLSLMGPGEYFGELALLDDAPRSASIMTLTVTKLMIVAKSDFQSWLDGNPKFAFSLIRALARRVRSLTERVKGLALMDVYGRVARTLLDLAEERDGKLVIEQRLTHQDIANMVGASREMVSRILGELTTGGYLSIKHKTIIINEKLPPAW